MNLKTKYIYIIISGFKLGIIRNFSRILPLKVFVVFQQGSLKQIQKLRDRFRALEIINGYFVKYYLQYADNEDEIGAQRGADLNPCVIKSKSRLRCSTAILSCTTLQ